MQTIGLKLQRELDDYLDNKIEFSPYYPNMNILISNLYKEQLGEVLVYLEEKDKASAKSFKLYLDTIIINMQSKIKKYKPSVYIEHKNVKDIENQGYTIPFFIDEERKVYVILGLIKNELEENSVMNSNSTI